MNAAGGISKKTPGILANSPPHALNSPSAVISVSTTYEINIGGVPYQSAADIARAHGYVGDYVARLCRQGEVRGRRLGKLWYVDTESFAAFVRGKAHSPTLSPNPTGSCIPILRRQRLQREFRLGNNI
jgi:hypothetical protein